MRAVATALLLAAALAACGGTAPPVPRPPNVILVVVDTLRHDRLGAYGSTAGLTPFLDRLAARAVVFHRAYAQAPWTSPSVASLMTSRYQSQHGVTSVFTPLPQEAVTLAEVLHDHGYATAGFTANPLVAAAWGYGQGFQRYPPFPTLQTPGPGYDRVPVRAGVLQQAAMQWLGGLDPAQPFFLYLQLMETHNPYVPPADLLARHHAGGAPDLTLVNAMMNVGVPQEPAETQLLRDVYDVMVATVDRALAQLFAALERRHALDHAIVVVTADHGEEFMDHGRIGHGTTLYQELIQVPLLVLPPDRSTRADVDDVVSLVDVAPTILDLIGIPAPDTFAGHSLAPGRMRRRRWRELPALAARWWRSPLPRDAAVSEHLVTAEQPGRQVHERAIVAGDRALLVAADGGLETYDLARDPAEQHTPGLSPPEAQALEGALGRFIAAFPPPPGTAAPARALDEQRERDLRALGYVQ